MIKKIYLPVVLFLIAANVFAQRDIVKTNAGKVSGITNKDGDVHIFKGIPYTMDR